MQYRRAESRVCPAEVEQTTGGRYFVRKNIIKESRTDNEGAAFDLWTYDEAVVSEVEYAAMAAVKAAELKRENEIVDEYTLQLIDEGVL